MHDIAQQRQAIEDVLSGRVTLDNNQVKGNYGEIIQDEFYRQQGYERISKDMVTGLDDAGHTGIDGVYYNPNGQPPYIISEAKYGSSGLSKNLADGTNQMDAKWINRRLDKAVSEAHATNIRKSLFIGDGNVQSNLFNVKENGNIIINQLDDAAKKMK